MAGLYITTDNTIVDGGEFSGDTGNPVITVAADNVVLKNLTVDAHESHAVAQYSGHNLTLDNCKLRVTGTARRSALSHQAGWPLTVVDSELSGGSNGVFSKTDEPPTGVSRITGNYMHTFDRSEGAGNAAGVIFGSLNTPCLDFGHRMLVADNVFDGARDNSIDLVSAGNVLVYRNTCYGYTLNHMLLGKSAGNGGHGSIIRWNTFDGGETLIVTRGGHGCYVADNVFMNGHTGIWVNSPNTFERNQFIDCEIEMQLRQGAGSSMINGQSILL